MKRIIYFLITAVVSTGVLFTTGCERSYDDPDPKKLYTDADMQAMGLTYISLKDLKNMYGNLGYDSGERITAPYYIKGKLVSSDKDGNIYRTMYLQEKIDGENWGMEIKIGRSGNYNFFSAGQTVYISVQDLIIANYRYAYSVGGNSVPNASGNVYPNGYIDVKWALDKKVFPGQKTVMEVGDTTVFRSTNDISEDRLGTLVRFAGLESVWKESQGANDDPYPSFFIGSPVYKTWSFVETIEAWRDYLATEQIAKDNGLEAPELPAMPKPAVLAYPTWAFNNTTDAYYGSALFRFDRNTSGFPDDLLVRTSGYSNFRDKPVTPDGTKVNITAIFNKYGSSNGGNEAYQLVLNSEKDVVVIE